MNKNLTSKDYRKIFFLYGIIYATIPIIICEIIWDIIFDGIGFKIGLYREIVESFFRAALIGCILLILTIIFGIIYIIVSFIKIKKVLKIKHHNNKKIIGERI